MDKNFNTDNFEHLLRETTDDFRMYPSKRVWHGIYNDLHPAKKWPSFAILLLLITSIMYIGVTNPDKSGQKTSAVSSKPNQYPAQLSPENIHSSGIAEATEVTPTNTRTTGRGDIVPAGKTSILTNRLNLASIQQTQSRNTETTPQDMEMAAAGTQASLVPDQLNAQHAEVDFATQTKVAVVKKATEGNAGADAIKSDETNTSRINNITEEATSLLQPQTTLDLVSKPAMIAIPIVIKPAVNGTIAGKDETGWMEDYAFRNNKSRDKWKGRMAYQLYVTPSVGYRTLNKNTDYSLPPTNALVVAYPNVPSSATYTFQHSSAINLEIGTGVLYSASKFLRLKAGVQLNYTNYSINAQDLNHPTFTSLMLTNTVTNTPVLSTRTTTLANSPGPASRYLNNNTYQVSLPIGADIKIAGNDKLKVYLGSTLQPTYILGGKSYLISADMKNYVAEEDFIRKYNLNGSVETFLTYKTKSGVTLNAGPQFRYQFFSTYNKMYTYDEKLYNLGVKLGMTKNF